MQIGEMKIKHKTILTKSKKTKTDQNDRQRKRIAMNMKEKLKKKKHTKNLHEELLHRISKKIKRIIV